MQSLFSFPLSLPCNLLHSQVLAYLLKHAPSKQPTTSLLVAVLFLMSLPPTSLTHEVVSEWASIQSVPPSKRGTTKRFNELRERIKCCFQGQTESMYSGHCFLVGACSQTFFIHLVHTYYIHTYINLQPPWTSSSSSFTAIGQ